jgi:hypothetical protein
MAGYVGLEGESVNNLIKSLSQETWRKRRAGLHLFNDYMLEKNINVETVLRGRAEVILSNCLSWREMRGGKGVLEDLRKIRTHVGVALSMFSESRNVG